MMMQGLSLIHICFSLRYQTTDLHKEEPDWNLRTEYEEKFAALGVPIKALIAVKEP